MTEARLLFVVFFVGGGCEEFFEVVEVFLKLFDLVLAADGGLDGVFVFLADLVVYFLAVDRKLAGCFYSQMHLAALDFQDFYQDIVPDYYTFV